MSMTLLTRAEKAALIDFLTGMLNDPDTLATSGLTQAEQDAVRRAHDKLLASLAGTRK